MADKKNFKLEETKGDFKLSGIVVGIAKENSFVSGETKFGKAYNTVKFGVKTSPINIINVELYGQEQDFVYPYSSVDKKSQKLAFKDRHNKMDDTYHIIGVNVTSEGSEKETYVEYDACEPIHQGFNDGDSVFITGELKPNSYISNSGELVSSFKYSIKSITFKEKPVDFDDPKFKETASFEQDIVITDTSLDNKTNKVIVNGYAIGYADSFKQVQYVIHHDKNEKLGNNFLKLKFGDYIKVLGTCINSPTVEEVEDEWGSEVPTGYKTGGKYVSELRITAVAKDKEGVSIFKKRRYKEDDFVQEEENEEVSNTNIDEDDLPF
jgi:single-stranded DNA-binding protein